LDAKRLLGVMVRLIPLLLVAACGRTEDGKPRPPRMPIPGPTRTLYVAASPNCGAGSPCYRSIQDAVDAASDGDLIKVAGGVYTSTESQVVTVKKGVHLVGGYGVGDWSEPDPVARPTILDAERVPGRRGVFVDGTDTLTITVAGFQIQRGYAKESEGGGICITGGSVVLEENSVLSSTAGVSGGGVSVSGGQVALRHNLIRGNSATYGGGLYVDGGEISLQGDIFTENEAGPKGGAIALGGGAITGTNVSVVQNPLAEAGVYLCGGHLAGSHWTLADNGRYGVVTHLGINEDGGSAQLRNSIVAYHSTGLGGANAGAHQTLFHEVTVACMTGASCVSNLFGDPKFVDRLHGDYHIQRDSAAVDQAYGMEVPVDMDGETRPMGSASDIGADEVDTEEFVYLPLVVRHSALANP
jgi:hypothetical protein